MAQDTISCSNNEVGLAGIEIGRVKMFVDASIHGRLFRLAVIQTAVRIHDNTLLPCYRMNDEYAVIRSDVIQRSIHIVPRWDRALLNNPEAGTEIYDNYEHVILNTHSDTAAWAKYYDHNE